MSIHLNRKRVQNDARDGLMRDAEWSRVLIAFK